MRKEISVSCPMDCFDLCRFVMTVENNLEKTKLFVSDDMCNNTAFI